MTDSATASASAGPTPHRREFGGVPGNLALIVGLPLATLYLYFAVRWNDGALLPGPRADWDGFLASLVPTWQAAAAYLGWLALQAALQAFLPGRVVEGTPLPGGGRLRYTMNGLLTFGLTAALVAGLHGTGLLPLRFWHDQFGALLSVMLTFTAGFSGFLYVYGRRTDPAPLRSGSSVHDFFLGTGHNPRIPPGGRFDLKLFCEARPGLQLWVLLNASFAAVQWERHGILSTPMLLVCGLQLLYIVDYFWNEPAILTTMDIKHERFGFMLAFGDLVWVPMTYSLQAHWLIDRGHHLPLWATILTLGLAGLGLYVFRAVNLQKHRFRADPEGARIWGRPAEYLETAQGSKLLVSGFWGWSRHFNYVGDILMAISWSLPCLFVSPLPWFYPVYFAALLVHRERRDHRICAARYGADWDRYCARVPWRILPRIY